MSISVRIVLSLVCLTAVEGCTSNQTGVYHNVGESPSFSFGLAIPTAGFQSFEVSKEGSSSFLSFSYNAGTLITQNIGAGITFTGDLASGDISFTVNSIQLSDGGTYSLKNILTSENLECTKLTVRGVVSVTLSVTNNPVETNQQVIFICEANSTTEPSVSSFTYTWRIKDESGTASNDPRYTFSENRFTMVDAQVSDTGTYMCTAAENIPGGGTASGKVSLIVNGTTTTTSSVITTSARAPTTNRSSTPTFITSLISNTTPVLLSGTTITTTADTTATTSSTPATTSTSAATSSASMTLTSTTEKAKLDQALITMIIVVSVLGGILLLAVFVLMFLLVHWKKCFLQTGHHKHAVPYPDYAVKGRRHKRHNTGREYSTTQMENALTNYLFYKGKRNPVYNGTLVTSSYSREGAFQDPKYTEQSAADSYNYNYTWKQMDMF